MEPVVDGHLDLAENVTLFGRDLTLPVAELRRQPGCDQATVTLPELERGGVAVAIATVTPGFKVEDVPPGRVPEPALYRTAEEAEAHALRQFDLYERWHREGRLRLLRSAADLDHHLDLWRADRKPGIVLLMEGADPIVEVRDLPRWRSRGLRLVGLTYGDTRYGAGVAGGSQPPRAGGLTDAGRELLREMAALGMGWDVSHLADEGVREGLQLGIPHACASHANARALTPTDRHLSDDVIRSLGRAGGVIGLVLYNGYLQAGWKRGGVEVGVGGQVRAHAEHIAAIAGWQAVGIGSDLDGGFGRDACPAEIDTVADLPVIGSLPPAEHRDAVLGGNWLRYLRRVL
jgi:membrane dipeptidase